MMQKKKNICSSFFFQVLQELTLVSYWSAEMNRAISFPKLNNPWIDYNFFVLEYTEDFLFRFWIFKWLNKSINKLLA